MHELGDDIRTGFWDEYRRREKRVRGGIDRLFAGGRGS